MRGVGVFEFGGPEQLRVVELPEPTAGPGEVVIAVHGAAVNPTDTTFRAGAFRAALANRPPPYRPGMDAAGVIQALGPDADGRLAVGQSVMAIVLPASALGGAYAEKIAVPADAVVPIPANADVISASTLLMNALTARYALDRMGLRSGQTVGVTGAAGAFGGYLIQLARADGLRVIADAAPQDVDLVRELGAHDIVPRGLDFAAEVRAVRPDGVDGLADGALLNAAALPAVAEGGHVVAVRAFEGSDAAVERGISLHEIRVSTMPRTVATLETLRAQVEDGTLTLRVAEVLPASQAERAHRRLAQGGVRGRIVLDFEHFDG